jgi:hypothetical protein
MAILFPQLTVKLFPLKGHDSYGKPLLDAPRSVRVGVVRLRFGTAKSSVRADSSASRGRVDESNDESVLLFEPTVAPRQGEVVEWNGARLRVVRVEPRYTLSGELAHYQVDLSAAGAV